MRLGQPVALKFLPEGLARDGRRVAQLHNERRMARQVTHVNDCRVYDIGRGRRRANEPLFGAGGD